MIDHACKITLYLLKKQRVLLKSYENIFFNLLKVRIKNIPAF